MDMYSEGGENDADYMRMVQDVSTVAVLMKACFESLP